MPRVSPTTLMRRVKELMRKYEGEEYKSEDIKEKIRRYRQKSSNEYMAECNTTGINDLDYS